MLTRGFQAICFLGFSLFAASNALAQTCEQLLPTLQVCHSRDSFYKAVADEGLPRPGLEKFEQLPIDVYPNGINQDGKNVNEARYVADTLCLPLAVAPTQDGHGHVVRSANNCHFIISLPPPYLAVGFDVTAEPQPFGQAPSSIMIGVAGYNGLSTTVPLPGWNFLGLVSTIGVGVILNPPNTGGVVLVDNVEYPNGPASSQTSTYPPVPCIPPSASDHRFCFIDAGGLGGGWYDPPPATGYTFATDGVAKFTAINDFPTGFSDSFTVKVSGNTLGRFGPGHNVDFPGGVTTFTISGIAPGVDGTNPGAFPIKLSLDTVGAMFSMEAFSVTDDTPPVVTPNVSGILGNSGWYVSGIALTWSTDDPESGVSSSVGCDPVTLSADMTGLTRTCTATNGVGVSTSSSVTIKIDQNAPSMVGLRAPDPNANGWNSSAVTVTFQCSDAVSGLAVGNPPLPTTVSTQGAGQSVRGNCTDLAGNSISLMVPDINIDTTPPVVACGAADGAWHAGDVSIACSASDPLSGLASVDRSFSLITAVSAGQETPNAMTSSRKACDLAGNCAAAAPIAGNKVDKKPPTVTITSPTPTTYLLHQSVASLYACSDGGSGVTSCQGPVASGTSVATGAPGSFSFAVNAADTVGNRSNASVPYSVTYAILPLYKQTQAFKSGSTIPIKLQLTDAGDADVSSQAVVVNAVSVVMVSTNASGTPADAGNANPDNNFRFDPTLGSGGGYIFNLQTTGLPTGVYAIAFAVSGDPIQHSVQFQLK